jgi:hypothetical protein
VLADRIRKSIDLDGYSRSFGWMGHFEKLQNVPYTRSLARDATQLVLSFLGDSFEASRILASSHISLSDKDVDQDELYDEVVVDRLIAAGLLTVEDYGQFWGDDELENDATVAKIKCSFREINPNDHKLDDLIDFLVSAVCSYHIRGHCFLVSAESDFAIYPHDDCGFGIVAIGDHVDPSFAFGLLRHSETDPRFVAKPITSYLRNVANDRAF